MDNIQTATGQVLTAPAQDVEVKNSEKVQLGEKLKNLIESRAKALDEGINKTVVNQQGYEVYKNRGKIAQGYQEGKYFNATGNFDVISRAIFKISKSIGAEEEAVSLVAPYLRQLIKATNNPMMKQLLAVTGSGLLRAESAKDVALKQKVFKHIDSTIGLIRDTGVLAFNSLKATAPVISATVKDMSSNFVTNTDDFFSTMLSGAGFLGPFLKIAWPYLSKLAGMIKSALTVAGKWLLKGMFSPAKYLINAIMSRIFKPKTEHQKTSDTILSLVKSTKTLTSVAEMLAGVLGEHKGKLLEKATGLGKKVTENTTVGEVKTSPFENIATLYKGGYFSKKGGKESHVIVNNNVSPTAAPSMAASLGGYGLKVSNTSTAVKHTVQPVSPEKSTESKISKIVEKSKSSVKPVKTTTASEINKSKENSIKASVKPVSTQAPLMSASLGGANLSIAKSEESIEKAVDKRVDSRINSFLTKLELAVTKPISAIHQAFQNQVKKVQSGFNKVIQTIIKPFKIISNKIKSTVDKITTGFKNQIEKIKSTFSSVKEYISTKIFKPITNTVKSIVTAPGKLISKILPKKSRKESIESKVDKDIAELNNLSKESIKLSNEENIKHPENKSVEHKPSFIKSVITKIVDVLKFKTSSKGKSKEQKQAIQSKLIKSRENSNILKVENVYKQATHNAVESSKISENQSKILVEGITSLSGVERQFKELNNERKSSVSELTKKSKETISRSKKSLNDLVNILIDTNQSQVNYLSKIHSVLESLVKVSESKKRLTTENLKKNSEHKSSISKFFSKFNVNSLIDKVKDAFYSFKQKSSLKSAINKFNKFNSVSSKKHTETTTHSKVSSSVSGVNVSAIKSILQKTISSIGYGITLSNIRLKAIEKSIDSIDTTLGADVLTVDLTKKSVTAISKALKTTQTKTTVKSKTNASSNKSKSPTFRPLPKNVKSSNAVFSKEFSQKILGNKLSYSERVFNTLVSQSKAQSKLLAMDTKLLKEIDKTLKDRLKASFSFKKLFDAIKKIPVAIKNAVVKVAMAPVKAIKNAILAPVKMMRSLVNNVKSSIKAGFNKVIKPFKAVANSIKKTTASIKSGITSAFKKSANYIKNSLAKVTNSTKGFFSNIKSGISSLFKAKSKTEKATHLIKITNASVKATDMSVKTPITNIEVRKSLFSQIGEGFTNIVESIKDKVAQFSMNIPGLSKIGEFFGNLFKRKPDKVIEARNVVINSDNLITKQKSSFLGTLLGAVLLPITLPFKILGSLFSTTKKYVKNIDTRLTKELLPLQKDNAKFNMKQIDILKSIKSFLFKKAVNEKAVSLKESFNKLVSNVKEKVTSNPLVSKLLSKFSKSKEKTESKLETKPITTITTLSTPKELISKLDSIENKLSQLISIQSKILNIFSSAFHKKYSHFSKISKPVVQQQRLISSKVETNPVTKTEEKSKSSIGNFVKSLSKENVNSNVSESETQQMPKFYKPNFTLVGSPKSNISSKAESKTAQVNKTGFDSLKSTMVEGFKSLISSNHESFKQQIFEKRHQKIVDKRNQHESNTLDAILAVLKKKSFGTDHKKKENSFLKNLFSKLFKGLGGLLGIGGLLGSLALLFGSKIVGALKGLVKGILGGTKKILSKGFNAIKKILSGVPKFLKYLKGKLTGAFKGAIAKLPNMVKGVKDSVVKIIKSAVKGIPSLITKVKGSIPKVFDKVKNIGSTLRDIIFGKKGLFPKESKLFSKTLTAVSSISSKIASKLSKIHESIISAISGIKSTFAKFFSKGPFSKIFTGLKNIPTKITEAIKGSKLLQKVSKATSKIAKAIPGLHKLQPAITKSTETVSKDLKALSKDLKSSVTTHSTEINKAVSENAVKREATAKSIKTKVEGIEKSVKSSTESISKSVKHSTEGRESLAKSVKEDIKKSVATHSTEINKSIKHNIAKSESTAKSVKENVENINKSVKTSAETVENKVSSESSKISKSVKSGVTNEIKGVKSSVSNEVKGVTNSVEKSATELKTSVTNQKKAITEELGKTSKSVENITKSTSELSAKQEAITKSVESKSAELEKSISTHNKAIKSSISETVSKSREGITKAVSENISKANTELKTSISSSSKNIKASVANQQKAINESLGKTTSEFKTSVENQQKAISEKLSKTSNELKGSIESSAKSISTSNEAIKSNIESATKELKSSATNQQKAISEKLSKSTESVTKSLETTSSDLKASVASQQESLSKSLTESNSKLKASVENQQKTISEALSKTNSELKTSIKTNNESLSKLVNTTSSDLKASVANQQKVITSTSSELKASVENQQKAISEALGKSSSEVKTSVEGINKSLTETVTKTSSELKTSVANQQKAITESLSKSTTEVKTSVEGINKSLTETVTKTSSDLKASVENQQKAISEALSKSTTDLKSSMKANNESLSKIVSSTSSDLKASVSDNASKLTKSMSNLDESIAKTSSELKTSLNATTDQLTKITTSTADELKTSISETSKSIKGSVEGINKTVSSNITELKTSVANQQKAINETLSKTSSELKSSIKTSNESLSKIVSSSTNELKSSVATQQQVLNKAIQGSTTEVKSSVEGVNKAIETTNAQVESVKSTVISSNAETGSKISKVSESLKSAKELMISKLLETKSAVTGVKSYMSSQLFGKTGLMSKISNKLSNVSENMNSKISEVTETTAKTNKGISELKSVVSSNTEKVLKSNNITTSNISKLSESISSLKASIAKGFSNFAKITQSTISSVNKSIHSIAAGFKEGFSKIYHKIAPKAKVPKIKIEETKIPKSKIPKIEAKNPKLLKVPKSLKKLYSVPKTALGKLKANVGEKVTNAANAFKKTKVGKVVTAVAKNKFVRGSAKVASKALDVLMVYDVSKSIYNKFKGKGGDTVFGADNYWNLDTQKRVSEYIGAVSESLSMGFLDQDKVTKDVDYTINWWRDLFKGKKLSRSEYDENLRKTQTKNFIKSHRFKIPPAIKIQSYNPKAKYAMGYITAPDKKNKLGILFDDRTKQWVYSGKLIDSSTLFLMSTLYHRYGVIPKGLYNNIMKNAPTYHDFMQAIKKHDKKKIEKILKAEYITEKGFTLKHGREFVKKAKDYYQAKLAAKHKKEAETKQKFTKTAKVVLTKVKSLVKKIPHVSLGVSLPSFITNLSGHKSETETSTTTKPNIPKNQHVVVKSPVESSGTPESTQKIVVKSSSQRFIDNLLARGIKLVRESKKKVVEFIKPILSAMASKSSNNVKTGSVKFPQIKVKAYKEPKGFIKLDLQAPFNTSALRKELIKHEGVVYEKYTDNLGFPTIGTGHLLPPHGIPLRNIIGIDTDKITPDQNTTILNYDIARTTMGLYSKLPWLSNQPDNIQRALVDMSFNMGIGGVLKFKKSLKYIKEGKYKLAAKELLNSRWAKQVGQRARDIVNLVRNTKPVSSKTTKSTPPKKAGAIYIPSDHEEPSTTAKTEAKPKSTVDKVLSYFGFSATKLKSKAVELYGKVKNTTSAKIKEAMFKGKQALSAIPKVPEYLKSKAAKVKEATAKYNPFQFSMKNGFTGFGSIYNPVMPYMGALSPLGAASAISPFVYPQFTPMPMVTGMPGYFNPSFAAAGYINPLMMRPQQYFAETLSPYYSPYFPNNPQGIKPLGPTIKASQQNLAAEAYSPTTQGVQYGNPVAQVLVEMRYLFEQMIRENKSKYHSNIKASQSNNGSTTTTTNNQNPVVFNFTQVTHSSNVSNTTATSTTVNNMPLMQHALSKVSF